MPGAMSGRGEAREQLVPKESGEGSASSTSPSHRFPIYDLPLPGTLPVSQDGKAPAPTIVSCGAGAGLRDEPATCSASSGAPQVANVETSTGPANQHLSPGTLAFPRPGSTGMPSAGGSSVLAAMEIQEALLPPQPPPAFEHPIPLGRRRWMVAMFCLVAALLYADQNLLAPNMTAAAQYFGMNERQKDVLLGGALMAAFFAVGAPAALVVGWLTDRGDINRRTLLFWVVVVGETPCLLTYWVREYWQFFLLRALTGVAVGGCFPLVFSLLGDLFPPKRRAAVSAVVQIATGLGLAMGQALSGAIGPATNWRLPFVVVAAPSLAVAVLMLLTTQEPPRGAFEEALQERYAEGLGAYEGSISWSKVRVLLRCPSNALVIAQGLPGSLPWGMVLTYFNDFLSQQKGFSVQAATLVLLMFGGAGAVGVIGGGAGGQWLYNRKKEYQALLAGGCVLAGIGPLYGLINSDLQRLGLAFTCFLAALGGAVASVAGPNLRSVMLNVNEPETRGMALALQSMTDDLGKGLGPVLVAGLIHAMGREGAFNVATAGWVPCSLMLASLACCMRRDEAAMQARLAKNSEAQAAAAEAQARRAADGDIGRGEGITVPTVLSPSGSEGGRTVAAEPPPLGRAADDWRQERRLARERLLGSATVDSSAAEWGTAAVSPAGFTAGAAAAAVAARGPGVAPCTLPAPAASSSMVGLGVAGTAGQGQRAIHAPLSSPSSPTVEQYLATAPAEGNCCALPLSSCAAVQEGPEAGAGSGPAPPAAPWGGRGGVRRSRWPGTSDAASGAGGSGGTGGSQGTGVQAHGMHAWTSTLQQQQPQTLPAMPPACLPVSPLPYGRTAGPAATAGLTAQAAAAADIGPRTQQGAHGLPGWQRPGPGSRASHDDGAARWHPHPRSAASAYDGTVLYGSLGGGELPQVDGSAMSRAGLGPGGMGRSRSRDGVSGAAAAAAAGWGVAAEGQPRPEGSAGTSDGGAVLADEPRPPPQPPFEAGTGECEWVNDSSRYLPTAASRYCSSGQDPADVRQAAEWLKNSRSGAAASCSSPPGLGTMSLVPAAAAATAAADQGQGGQG